jgi:undecaprenyl-diphosphatase
MYLLAGFWERLIEWDKNSFIYINHYGANDFFDRIMPFMRKSTHWVPLYTFLLFFMLLNFGKRGLWWCLLFLATVALTDMTGTYIFKHEVERLRPCQDPGMEGFVRLVINQCAGGSSFISNHAANHFGMAAFFFVTYRHFSRWAAWLGIAWAFVIAYAQVYVGVHYPLDVICGGLIGFVIGSLTGHLFNKRFGFSIFEYQPLA